MITALPQSSPWDVASAPHPTVTVTMVKEVTNQVVAHCVSAA
jgi:hypothetical protein